MNVEKPPAGAGGEGREEAVTESQLTAMIVGMGMAADVVDQVLERYTDPAARAALGLAADSIRKVAAEMWPRCGT